MGDMMHTPGPWAAENPMEGWDVRADDPNRPGKRLHICHMGPSYRSKKDADQAFANAHLIALVPEMFEYIASSASNGCATAKALIAKAEAGA